VGRGVGVGLGLGVAVSVGVAVGVGVGEPHGSVSDRQSQRSGLIMETELLPVIFDSVAADSATSTVKAVRHEDSGYW
jgi:hypothetical protein